MGKAEVVLDPELDDCSGGGREVRSGEL